MKSNFTRLLRKGLLFSGLALTSLLLYNCSSKDLEFIDPFEFVYIEFENVEMVPVADPDPVFEDPNTGEVALSEETTGIIADVLAANSGGEIDPTTVAAQQTVQEFAAQVPADVLVYAEDLEASDIAAILDPNTELDPALIDLEALLEQAPADLLALLPQMEFTSTVAPLAFQAAMMKGKIIVDKGNMDPMAQSTLFGPCVDAADEAYDAAIGRVEVQRDDNLAVIAGNEVTRLTAVDERLQTRLVQHGEDYTANAELILTETEQLLAAAASAEAIGETQLADDLQLLALIYAVQGRLELMEWNDLVLIFLEATKDFEIATVEQLAIDRTAEVIASFDAAIAEADDLLVQAYNNCHNQGAGN